MNTAYSHPSIKRLKRRTSSNDAAAAASDDDDNDDILRFFQLMIISLIVNVHANIDKRPPTFGMIALEMSSDEKPAIVYYFLKILSEKGEQGPQVSRVSVVLIGAFICGTSC
jgi:hypothetical protein